MNNAGRGLRGDGVMWYSTNGDRLIPDRRRQTNFTLLGEPLQSWHHNVPCFCQRSERDKWQRAAALLFSVSNICPDVCFSQGFFYFVIFFCSGLAIFNTQPSYCADRTADLACASVSQQIKKGALMNAYIYSLLLLSSDSSPIQMRPWTFLNGRKIGIT